MSQNPEQLPFCDRLVRQLGPRYIAAMLLTTRACGSLGGALVVYYVNLTLTLEEPTRTRFIIVSAIVVLIAVVLALLTAMWETRHLRPALKLLKEGQRPDEGLAEAAGREAVLFPVRHHLNEAWLVPTTTLVPVLLLLWMIDKAPAQVLGNIALAVFMGIGLALMSTFFIIERLMQPVVRYLLEQGIAIQFDSLPANRLRSRLNLSFGLIILITALMISTLAIQRAADIIQTPDNQQEAVANLRTHTTYITLAAIIVGLAFATTISESVASRVARLVQAMKAVEQGSLSQELRATGNDEIDVLTRQFNSMVLQLARNDATIRDLNTNLERKVDDRTLTLRLLHSELDERNVALEAALKDLTEMQSQLVDVAHKAGMTEIATGVLHNVGNVLNSVNVSITLLGKMCRTSKIASVAKVAALLKEHAPALEQAASDSKIAKMPAYVAMLADSLETEQREMLGEIGNLEEKTQHIKNIISAQQNYTRRVSFKENVDLHSIIHDLLLMHGASMSKHSIKVERNFDSLPTFTIEKAKLLQVIDNLVKNAVEAMESTPRDSHVLKITTRKQDGQAVIEVTDTGHGIPADQLNNIFRFGFTTKTNGNGFGLHSAALAISEMSGSIRVDSPGEGQGATFTITLPLQTEKASPETVSKGVKQDTAETTQPSEELATVG